MSIGWEEELFGLLKSHEIAYLPFVPDAGHAKVLSMAEEDNQLTPVVLTTEEEGVASVAGHGLAASGLCY
jgi:sulfopyruvate decarboxylase TPP-binding subunit